MLWHRQATGTQKAFVTRNLKASDLVEPLSRQIRNNSPPAQWANNATQILDKLYAQLHLTENSRDEVKEGIKNLAAFVESHKDYLKRYPNAFSILVAFCFIGTRRGILIGLEETFNDVLYYLVNAHSESKRNHTYPSFASAERGKLRVILDVDEEGNQILPPEVRGQNITELRHGNVGEYLVKSVSIILFLYSIQENNKTLNDLSEICDIVHGIIEIFMRGLYLHFFVVDTYAEASEKLYGVLAKLEGECMNHNRMKTTKGKIPGIIAKCSRDLKGLREEVSRKNNINDENRDKLRRVPTKNDDIDDIGLKKETKPEARKVLISRLIGDGKNSLAIPKLYITESNEIVELGKGGYGVVHKQKVKLNGASIDSEVAIKSFCDTDDDMLVRILREARCMKHAQAESSEKDGKEFVAKLLGVVIPDPERLLPKFVIELADSTNENLLKYAKSTEPKYTLRDRIERMIEVAKGLHHLHTLTNEPIFHGDLKATNVLIYNGHARLSDFGSALVDDNIRGYTTGSKSYTMCYRAPEIRANCINKPNAYTDIYAFGCVFFETLSGKMPHENVETSKEQDQSLEEKLMTPDWQPTDNLPKMFDSTDFPDEYKRLMDDCFTLQFKKRPDAKALKDRLGRILEKLP